MIIFKYEYFLGKTKTSFHEAKNRTENQNETISDVMCIAEIITDSIKMEESNNNNNSIILMSLF